ncbi:hypothetical protein [Nonomuraea aridisoli]|uniref:hypothetical protein n=1 Tax=Nonomuraea aridisoli TaxID=2070368 RepID=UPI0015E8D833|nr:hypothetical protein [Nonomuraea aridisoli]
MADLAGDVPGAASAIYRKIEAEGAETATKGLLTTAAWHCLQRAFAVGFPTA